MLISGRQPGDIRGPRLPAGRSRLLSAMIRGGCERCSDHREAGAGENAPSLFSFPSAESAANDYINIASERSPALIHSLHKHLSHPLFISPTMPGGKNQCFPHPSICPATGRVMHYSASVPGESALHYWKEHSSRRRTLPSVFKLFGSAPFSASYLSWLVSVRLKEHSAG